MGSHLMKRSSSKGTRGKKGELDKPRQPQRGLGVAQLEKLRLQNLINSGCLSSSQGLMHRKVGFGEVGRTDMRHNKAQHTTFRIIPMEGNFHQPLMPINVTLPLLSQSEERRWEEKWNWNGSTTYKFFDLNEAHGIDLELKLSC